MDDQDLKLDGNAAAGLLRELFTFELTTATGRCDNCGAIAEVGADVGDPEQAGGADRS